MEEIEAGSGATDGGYQLGECHGGPWDGRSVGLRRPKGFLLVDKISERVWIYDWNGQAFICREPEGRDEDFAKRWDAAEDPDWDVLSARGLE